MKNTFAIRREDLSKTGEKRVAVVPEAASHMVQQGFTLLVQPGVHPGGVNKRAFEDSAYAAAGARITEDISAADVIFGLKEIGLEYILPEKTYLFFSHTHKGQIKNRKMLAELVARKCTVLDYELVTDEKGARLITAFTYMAGRAGMIDSLWTLGRRLSLAGIENPFSRIPQSIEKEDLGLIKEIIAEAAEEIRTKGTPASLPPVITCFLGDGKTGTGAMEIYNLLPVKRITQSELAEVYRNGSRKFVYELVLDITTMFRLKESAGTLKAVFSTWSAADKRELYFKDPALFESNLDQVLPYVTMVMNCIIWAPQYPRVVTKANTLAAFAQGSPLQVIGDISCDPNGGVEYCKETWIDNPVYIYHPETEEITDGFAGAGIAVMAVANLPCEFSADASIQFSENLEAVMPTLLHANLNGSLEESGLAPAFQRSCLLWKGGFTPRYAYMKDFLGQSQK